jgi:hypothetical protein
MKINSFFLVVLVFLGMIVVIAGQAQTIPKTLPPKGNRLPKATSLLPDGLGMEFLTSELEIPYLDELRQIQSLKQSYDSIKTELKELREHAQDSTKKDSLVMVARERGREILEKESQVLESLIESEEIPGVEIRNAASRTLEGVKSSKNRLSGIQDLESLESLVDQNEENLKALTNEWLMPKVEQVLSGTANQALEPSNLKFPDFYGKGGLQKLMQEGIPADISFEEAKTLAKGKALHISETYVEELKGKYSKVKFDSLGNIQIIHEAVTKRKFVLWEENEMKAAALLERLGLYAWYDPLTSFGEGIYGDIGLTYRFTHQLQAFGGMVYKRDFSDSQELTRTGQGAKLSLRFAKGNWFVQSELARVNMKIDYPGGYDDKDFDGMEWTTGLGFGCIIPMGDRIQSLVLTTWDPTYTESKSLANSPFQLKIGFEWKGLKIDRMKKTDLEEYRDKVPTDKIQQKLKKQTEIGSPVFLK